MSVGTLLTSASKLTGLAACLFAAGVVALLGSLLRDATHGGALLWIAIVLLVATVACWAAAARAESRGNP